MDRPRQSMTPLPASRTGQLALDLSGAPDYRAESFAVSEANAAALAIVNRWPSWRHGHLLVLGPPASGKTHLAEMWRTRANARRLDPQALSDALSRLEPDAAVLVEDCDRGVDEDGLFHLLNRAAGETGATVLLTARRPPAEWNVTLPDLGSRLAAAETAVLREPDDALLRQVMEKLFRDRRTPLSPGVLEYLLARMERSVAFARLLVETLDRAALARKKPVTRSLAREALSAVLTEEDAAVADDG